MSRLSYWTRVIPAYVFRSKSQLAFWHQEPRIHDKLDTEHLGAYHMDFTQKAFYSLHLDSQGLPLLDYQGSIGKQYNPIAMAQYALGHFNLYLKNKNQDHGQKFLKAADWLLTHLKNNPDGVPVWMHDFDWEYQQTLKAPWYSGLAQGQGLSVLTRAFQETGEQKYMEAAARAYRSLTKDVQHGGVVYWDAHNDPWIEEYLVQPPTHILNGFIWALWGVRDYFLLTNDNQVRVFWEACLKTLEKNLHRFDTGFWSLYDLSEGSKNVASFFYHKLHIVQLEIMYGLTRMEIFLEYSRKWRDYSKRSLNWHRAFIQKAIFKLMKF